MIRQLRFIYPSDEFAEKFLSSSNSVLNTCISLDGDVNVYFLDGNFNCCQQYLDKEEILKDLTQDHKSMQDESYNYKLVYSYVEMESQEYGQDVVFFRVEKTKKEGN